MSGVAAGGLAGAAAGTGVLLVVLSLSQARTPRLADRVSAFAGTDGASRLLGARPPRTPFPTLERITGPVLRDLAAVAERWLGGTGSLRRRLARAGRDRTLEEFRVEQVLWGAASLLGGLSLMVLLVVAGQAPPVGAAVVLCLGAALLGALARDSWLTHQVKAREERMLTELPTIAELLALAVTAGEGAAGALGRVCRISGGELAAELRTALAEAATGVPLVQVLETVASRTGLAPLARFVDGLVIAIERGTPLADVLRAQAVDVRAAGKRALLESAGRREIAMLVPVVFLVLPVTVVFALFPGFYGFQVIAP